MTLGEKATLTIPWECGYGEKYACGSFKFIAEFELTPTQRVPWINTSKVGSRFVSTLDLTFKH